MATSAFATSKEKAQALSELAETMTAMLSAQQKIVGALQAVAPFLPKAEARPKKQKLHERAGAKWTATEDEEVVAQFESGASVEEIAREQQRSWVAIMARLEHLGYLPRDLRLADLDPPPRGKGPTKTPG